MDRPRIVAADDNPRALQTVVSLLASEFDLVATASDGSSAADAIERYRPDIAVLELSMPGLNGLEITRKFMQNPASDLAIVICSVETDPEIIEAAVKAGASAYVLKRRMAQDLVPAVKAALARK